MYEKIFQRAVFPVLDRLNRTEISKVLAFLGETESCSESELRGLQDRKLSEILNWTREHSGFYRDFWAGAGQDRRASSDYPELDGLPVVTKDDLREAASQFPLPAYKGKVLEIRTSGSTGYADRSFCAPRSRKVGSGRPGCESGSGPAMSLVSPIWH